MIKILEGNFFQCVRLMRWFVHLFSYCHFFIYIKRRMAPIGHNHPYILLGFALIPQYCAYAGWPYPRGQSASFRFVSQPLSMCVRSFGDSYLLLYSYVRREICVCAVAIMCPVALCARTLFCSVTYTTRLVIHPEVLSKSSAMF